MMHAASPEFRAWPSTVPTTELEKCLCLSPSCRGWHSGSAWVDDDNQARWVLRGRLAFEQPVVPQMERAGRAESEPRALRPCS